MYADLQKKNPSVNKKLLCERYNIPKSSLYYKPRKIIEDTITKTKIQITHIFDPYYGHRRVALFVDTKKELQIVDSSIFKSSKMLNYVYGT